MKVLLLFIAAAVGGAIRAESIDDIARFHAAAIGGRERIATLSGLSASGVVRAGGHEMSFEMQARRPNRVRITTRGDGQTLVQGWDGAEPPWRFVPELSPVAQSMPVEEAAAFAADAEFDDPLIAGRQRGYALDYAGEADWAGRPVWRVLVTRLGEAAYTLLVDRKTYFIVARISTRSNPSGVPIAVEARFSDFRPVDGVILPFRIEGYASGRLTQETILTEITARRNLPAARFARPTARSAE